MACDAYLICTSPRSGSTLLCRMLTDTGVAGAPNSHFHKPSLAAWARAHKVDVPAPPAEVEALPRILLAARQTGRGGTDVFGARIQQESFAFFRDQLAVLYPEEGDDLGRITAAFGTTKIFYLTRGDKVGQAVSVVKAQQTGLWHQAPDGTEIERLTPPAEPVYDGAALKEAYDGFLAREAGWAAWFDAEGIAPVRITYEALSEDPIGRLRDVLAAIGQDPAVADEVEPGTAKLADAVSQQWVERFREEYGLQG